MSPKLRAIGGINPRNSLGQEQRQLAVVELTRCVSVSLSRILQRRL
jgi:hypothetical protein